jgi:hypothetical protein
VNLLDYIRGRFFYALVQLDFLIFRAENDNLNSAEQLFLNLASRMNEVLLNPLLTKITTNIVPGIGLFRHFARWGGVKLHV